MNLRLLQTFTPVTSDTCVPGEMGTGVTLSFPGPYPMLVLCHKAETSWSGQGHQRGEEGCGMEAKQRVMDDGCTLQCGVVLKDIS